MLSALANLGKSLYIYLHVKLRNVIIACATGKRMYHVSSGRLDTRSHAHGSVESAFDGESLSSSRVSSLPPRIHIDQQLDHAC